MGKKQDRSKLAVRIGALCLAALMAFGGLGTIIYQVFSA